MMMNSTEKRKKVVSLVLSREGKNQYTQGDKRLQCDRGWSDCSALQYWAYLQLGVNIGTYTGAQIEKGEWAQLGGSYPDESKLRLGDLLFFQAGYNNGRSYNVGHVEMYVGDGQISGHGSGVGPTRKNMVAYCQNRNNNGQRFIGVKRYIPDDGSEIKVNADVTYEVMFVGECTGDDVNVRKGPGTSYANITEWPKLNKTNLVDVLEKIGSWYLVRIAGKYNGYVHGDNIKKHVDSATAATTTSSGTSLNRTPKWVGKVTADCLNVRTWAGTNNPNLRSWPRLNGGNLVDVCDSIKASNGDIWYYIRIAGKYYGFASAKYIKKA